MTINPPSLEDIAKLSHSNRVKFAIFCAEQVLPISIEELKRDANKKRRAGLDEASVLKSFTGAQDTIKTAIRVAKSYTPASSAWEIEYRKAYAFAIQKANVLNILHDDFAFTAVYLIAHAKAEAETANGSDNYTEEYMDAYDAARIPVIRAQWKYIEGLT